MLGDLHSHPDNGRPNYGRRRPTQLVLSRTRLCQRWNEHLRPRVSRRTFTGWETLRTMSRGAKETIHMRKMSESSQVILQQGMPETRLVEPQRLLWETNITSKRISILLVKPIFSSGCTGATTIRFASYCNPPRKPSPIPTTRSTLSCLPH